MTSGGGRIEDSLSFVSVLAVEFEFRTTESISLVLVLPTTLANRKGTHDTRQFDVVVVS